MKRGDGMKKLLGITISLLESGESRHYIVEYMSQDMDTGEWFAGLRGVEGGSHPSKPFIHTSASSQAALEARLQSLKIADSYHV